mmetsp:Transcript_7991/g.26740  ORF Transcript_7991/g.26740 Transcript_7991/m.26740 type:complete len:171 (-) Transcript_7991:93-605(-)
MPRGGRRQRQRHQNHHNNDDMGTTSSKSRTNARRDDAMMRERTDDADAARAPPTPTRKCKAKTKDTLLNAKDGTTTTTKTPCPYVVDIAKLYAHDARLERAVCAVAIVRQSIGEFVEDTNFWLARALARDATKKVLARRGIARSRRHHGARNAIVQLRAAAPSAAEARRC